MNLPDEVLRHAREAGIAARQNARALADCPLYAMGQQGAEWRRAWTDGWESEHAAHLRRFPHLAEPAKKPKATPIKRGKRK